MARPGTDGFAVPFQAGDGRLFRVEHCRCSDNQYQNGSGDRFPTVRDFIFILLDA
jgi:hypothetical protein